MQEYKVVSRSSLAPPVYVCMHEMQQREYAYLVPMGNKLPDRECRCALRWVRTIIAGSLLLDALSEPLYCYLVLDYCVHRCGRVASSLDGARDLDGF